MNKFVLGFLCAMVTAASVAGDFDSLFSEDTFISFDVETSAAEQRLFSVSHELGAQAVINVNSEKTNAIESLYSGVTSSEVSYRPGFSFQPNDAFSVSAEALLSIDGIFWLRPDDAWSEADVDARQYQADIKALVAQYRLKNWQFSTGIQTVTLGLADALSLSNVLNAQDLSVPGLKDMNDAVLPAWTTMASGAQGSVRIKAGVVHRHQLNQLPIAGTDFDTGLDTWLTNSGLTLEQEDFTVANMAGFASFSGVVGPLDWQLNAISQREHSPVVELGLSGMGPVPVALHYPRTTTLGLAGSYVVGSVLWKVETALVDGLQAQTMNGTALGPLAEFQRVGGTVGFDFNSNRLGRVVAEMQVTTILDYDSLALMQTDEKSVQWVLMYSKNFLRDRLTLTGQVIGFDIDASGGRVQGITLEYDVNDQLSTTLRYIDYVAGDFQFFNGADDRDRLLASARYRF